IAMYMAVFAKVILVDPSQLNDVCAAMVSGGQSGSMEEALELLLEIFFAKFQALGYASSGSYRRRLWVVSLLNLYPTENQQLLSRLGDVLTLAEEVYSEETSETGQERLNSLNRLLVAESTFLSHSLYVGMCV